MKIAIKCLGINCKNQKYVRVLISQSDYKESDRISSGLIAKKKFHTATGIIVSKIMYQVKIIVSFILAVEMDGKIGHVLQKNTNASRVN